MGILVFECCMSSLPHDMLRMGKKNKKKGGGGGGDAAAEKDDAPETASEVTSEAPSEVSETAPAAAPETGAASAAPEAAEAAEPTSPAPAAAPAEAAPVQSPPPATAVETEPVSASPLKSESELTGASKVLEDKLLKLKGQLHDLRSSIKGFEEDFDRRLDQCLAEILGSQPDK